jgi:hypothetical protein
LVLSSARLLAEVAMIAAERQSCARLTGVNDALELVDHVVICC